MKEMMIRPTFCISMYACCIYIIDWRGDQTGVKGTVATRVHAQADFGLMYLYVCA